MQIRLVIFILLSLLIIMSYQYIFLQKPEDIAKGKGTLEKGETEKKGAITQIESSPEIKEKLIKTLDSPYSKEQKITKDEYIQIDTDLYSAKFSKSKAILEEMVLKKYKDKNNNKIILIGKIGKEINRESSRAIDFILAKNSSQPQAVAFDVDKKSLTLSKNVASGVINFVSASLLDGLRITKSLKFDNNSYLINMRVVVENLNEVPVNISTQILLGPSFYPSLDPSDSYDHLGLLVKSNGKVVRENPEKIKDPLIFQNRDLDWIGMESKYFLASLIPEQKNFTGFMLKDRRKNSMVGLKSLISKIEAKSKLSQNFDIYMGPKEFNTLQALKLENAIDFGWFGVLGIPLLKALNFFNLYLKNYGVSIIIITVIIKVLFIPLTQKSFKSMQAMQKLQPQIKALRERYKKDPQKLNQETMELYRKNKVNPMGGCFPMLLQIPVFIAFYNVLLNSIELRGAPFFLWITDLSAKDPYYITPIIMGITMFIQQKMSPTSPDPKQAQIMLIMPVIFTFMFMSFPTGLVLYWTVNNILSIGQQYLLMGKVGIKEIDKDKGKNRKKKN